MTEDILNDLEKCAYDYKDGEIDQFTYAHYELICKALRHIEDLNQTNMLFRLSCEIDGFGHVRYANFTGLTAAYKSSSRYYND